MIKKITSVATLLLSTLQLIAQITITRNDMPNPLDTVYMGITNNLHGVDATLAGANYNWDFAALTSTNTRLDTFVAVSSAPFAYQLYFNNQITKNSSDVAQKIDDLPLPALSPIQITKVYGFYKNPNKPAIPIINPNPERLYAQTGFGATVNNIPTSVAFDPQFDMDVWYKFPMNYGNQDSCYSTWKIDLPNVALLEERRHRTNVVDGWGTVTTPLGTFNCLRVKSVSEVEDSLKFKSGPGAALPGIKTIQYVTEFKWLALGKKEPVLKVSYNSLTKGVLGALTLVEYQKLNPNSNSLSSINAINGLKAYYDNASNSIYINNQTNKNTMLNVYNVEGKLMLNKTIPLGTQIIVLNNLTKGMYIAKLEQDEQSTQLKFITE
jgi:hypothetical protein